MWPTHPAQAPTFQAAVPIPNSAASLCCGSVIPHAPVQTHWEDVFQQFLAWLAVNGQTTATAGMAPGTELILRLTTTIQYGRLCGTMEYSGVRTAQGCIFAAVPTGTARANGFTDRSAFKNYRCAAHQLYFQIDLHRRPGA